MADEDILKLDNVSFSYSDSVNFKELNLSIRRGDFVLINGPSGSGKSTLLRLLARLEEATSGIIYFNSIPYSDYQPSILRQMVTLIQQTPTILQGSVYENLLLPFSFTVNKLRVKPTKEFLIDKLSELKLYNIIDKEATTLSVGQKQRVSILRTLLLQPEVLLMDEPTSALDPESKAIVEDIAEVLNKSGKTIIMINHSSYRPNISQFSHLYIDNGKVEAVR